MTAVWGGITGMSEVGTKIVFSCVDASAGECNVVFLGRSVSIGNLYTCKQLTDNDAWDKQESNSALSCYERLSTRKTLVQWSRRHHRHPWKPY